MLVRRSILGALDPTLLGRPLPAPPVAAPDVFPARVDLVVERVLHRDVQPRLLVHLVHDGREDRAVSVRAVPQPHSEFDADEGLDHFMHQRALQVE